MLQQATRRMVEDIPRDRWREVTVKVTPFAIELFGGAVSCLVFVTQQWYIIYNISR